MEATEEGAQRAASIYRYRAERARAQLDSYAPSVGDLVDVQRVVVAHYVGHFFDPGTMRAFGSRLAEYGYRGTDGAVYFVTSERDRTYGEHPGAWNGQRRYTVRRWCPEVPDGIDGVTEFGEYASRTGADRRARAEARKEGAA